MKVFISGVSGSLGTAVALYHRNQGDEVVGCARSESKLVQWMRDTDRAATVYSCDVCELSDETKEVTEKLVHSDRVYHLSALKHVDICENQPDEALLQNVYRTGIIAYICQTVGIPLIFASTDKACGAGEMSVYGATKLLAEKEVLRRGGAVVRFGNLIGSSGSVFQKWQQAVKQGKPIEVTDPLMTRFFIGIEKAAQFMAERTIPGTIVAPVMHAAKMGQVASKVEHLSGSGVGYKIIGRRPGETRHQWVFAPDTRIWSDGSRYVLDESKEYSSSMSQGVCSANAPQWDLDELLHLAGVL